MTQALANLSFRHQSIVDFMVAYPTAKKGEIAEHFGVTPAWLSIVIHSDAFQAAIRARQDELFRHHVVPLAEKLAYLAHRTIDKLAEKVETTDEATLLEIGKFSTDRINWDGKPMAQAQGGGAVGVHVHITSQQILEEARARVIRGRQGATIEHTADPNSAASARLPSGRGD